MLTIPELIHSILAPALVAALVAVIGRWRRWTWAMPLAVGAGFLAGYALLRMPKLPPSDGTDWLFWLAIPLTLLGVIDALAGLRWGWLAGAAAGAVAFVIVRPLVPNSVTFLIYWLTIAGLALAGTLLAWVCLLVEPKIGMPALVAGLCIAVGGAAVMELSSNMRVVGTYGLAAASALGAVAVLSGGVRVGRSVAIVAVSILAGLLVGGRFYPDPGVTWGNFVVLMLSPLLMAAGATIPGKRNWVRGIVALALVAGLVAAVAAPAAITAKNSAESDPYSANP